MKKIKFLTLGIVMTVSALTASAQKWGATPEDSVACITSKFLYNEDYKNNQLVEAYENWKICIDKCPANHINLYKHGAKILKAKYQANKDAESRKAVVDELMDIYDLRIKYFCKTNADKGEVLAIKAYDLEQLGGDAALKEYYKLYDEAVKLDFTKIQLAYIERYFAATIKYVTTGYADTTLIVDNYDLVSDALESLVDNAADSAEKSKVYAVIANVENLFSPFASCEELVKIYTKKFEANPDDLVLLKKITTILRKKKCMDTELFFAATKKLHTLEPSYSTAYLMAQMCYNQKNYSDAAKYVGEALDGAEEKDKYNMYILQGLCYANSNSYSAARNAYNKAMAQAPGKGEPYRLLAQLYASSIHSIDDNLGGRTAYWAAVDAARKAIAVDDSPENVEAANRLISSYSAHFPKKDAAFMEDLIDGKSYTVPGWIGVSTTVRTRN